MMHVAAPRCRRSLVLSRRERERESRNTSETFLHMLHRLLSRRTRPVIQRVSWIVVDQLRSHSEGETTLARTASPLNIRPPDTASMDLYLVSL